MGGWPGETKLIIKVQYGHVFNWLFPGDKQKRTPDISYHKAFYILVIKEKKVEIKNEGNLLKEVDLKQ